MGPVCVLSSAVIFLCHYAREGAYQASSPVNTMSPSHWHG